MNHLGWNELGIFVPSATIVSKSNIGSSGASIPSTPTLPAIIPIITIIAIFRKIFISVSIFLLINQPFWLYLFGYTDEKFTKGKNHHNFAKYFFKQVQIIWLAPPTAAETVSVADLSAPSSLAEFRS
jgi:hypothetical protein